MPRVLLDTDILSEVLKNKHPGISAKAVGYQREYGKFTTSSVTVVEIVKGLHKLGQSHRLASFITSLAELEILLLDRAGAEIAGRIYADLERTGQTIGRADPMIAGIAIANSLTLVSVNLDHYERIQKFGYPLRIENWRA